MHKPLLTLILLSRAIGKLERELYFREVADSLEHLLRQFGPTRKSYHPEFPFWHLQSDGFWEVNAAKEIPLTRGGKSPSKRILLDRDARGQVPARLWRALVDDPSLCVDLANDVLDDFWPTTLHEAIRQSVGLPEAISADQALTRRRRDPRFRSEVLRAYERRCAVCGYDGRLADIPLALEAAHIRWHSYRGPDEVDNALALCSLHHVALDSGAIGLGSRGEVLVSADVTGGREAERLLVRHVGSFIRPPQSRYPSPNPGHVSWHRKQVFKEPAREAIEEASRVAERKDAEW